MLQYLIILLDERSVSYCHYGNSGRERQLMPIDTLRQGILFGMKENLMIQFVYPDYELPEEYNEAIETIDHSKIKGKTLPSPPCEGEGADVWVINDWSFPKGEIDVPLVVRTSKAELFARRGELKDVLGRCARLNVVITDVETFTDDDFSKYKEVLGELAESIETLYVSGKTPQLNLLTDRMMLEQMNNCGAGDTNITLAPNGRFYVCPAFYYEDEADSVGDLETGLDIRNRQLYKLEQAPICRHCDAWHCKRCVWLNRKTTLEVNTPSHEQCVAAHLERNAAARLLTDVRRRGTFMPGREDIKETEYLDPFDKINEWQ